MRLREFDEKEKLEKANEKLTKYKTAAGADATAADAAGNLARGNTRFKGINRATKKQFANDAKLAKLKEFAPSGDDGDGFSEETLKQLAAQWYNGDEDPRVEQTLMSAGWEIGQDEGYDNGGVFVVRAGDDQGDSYISWPSEELAMNEGRKKKNKKTSRSLGRYFFPGFGYYGSGESSEGGGDGGGGESANPGMEEGEYDSRKPFGVRYKVFAGREGRLTTREYYTSSEEKLQRAVAKIEALDNFYEIDGYSYPKESQGVAEGSGDAASATPTKNERGRYTAWDDDEPMRLKCKDGEFRTIQEINMLRQKIGMKPFSIKSQQAVAEDSIAAMRHLAGIVTPTAAVVSNGQRQYRHMPTAVQPR